MSEKFEDFTVSSLSRIIAMQTATIHILCELLSERDNEKAISIRSKYDEQIQKETSQISSYYENEMTG